MYTQAPMGTDPWEQAWALLMEWIGDINPNYRDLIEENHPSVIAKKDLIQDVLNQGIFLNVPPFLEGLDHSRINELKEKYHLCKSRVTLGVEQRDGSIKMVTTKKPVMIGDQYFFLLYKMPHLRCAGLSYVNQYRTPIKPSSLAKLQYPFAQTPIKFGEDEIRNLELVAGPEVPARLLGLYANSAEAVNMLAEHLLLSKNPAKLDHIDMTTEQIVQSNAIVGVAKHIFSCFGVEISTDTKKLKDDPYQELELPTDKK